MNDRVVPIKSIRGDDDHAVVNAPGVDFGAPEDSLVAVGQFHLAFGIENRAAQGFPTAKHPLLEQTYLRAYAHMLEGMARDLKVVAGETGSPLLLRLQLCTEELGELARAMVDNDLQGCLDALCDMRYVADGTTLALGLQHVFNEAFAEVHHSNMSKLDGDGKPVIGPSGRVEKSALYQPPRLGRFIDEEA